MMMVVSHCVCVVRQYCTKCLHEFPAGDLEITCFTNVTGDAFSGRTIQLFFDANQDAVTFTCGLNDQVLMSCENKYSYKQNA